LNTIPEACACSSKTSILRTENFRKGESTLGECPFKIGDRVERNGISGMVIARYRFGDGWILKVRLPEGDRVSWSAHQVKLHAPESQTKE
jgi:hypothetical protein